MALLVDPVVVQVTVYLLLYQQQAVQETRHQHHLVKAIMVEVD
jgi:hypothetical protein